MLCVAGWLLVTGCTSKVSVQPQQPPMRDNPPAAWAMMPSSNSLTLLQETFRPCT
ncbi:lysis system o-spanin lipoprotein Rz1 [Erwinia tracheiphila]